VLTIPELQAARKLRTLKFLNCPHCGAQINGPAALIVSTRNCPSCGRRVVAEPEGTEETPPFAREVFNEACAAYTRAAHRASLVLLAGFLVFFASIVVLALYRDTIRAAVQPVMDPSWFFLLVVFGPCGGFFVMGLWRLGRARRNALPCPHCNVPCSVVAPGPVPNMTQVTGNCTSCGRRLLNEALPEEPAGPLPTVDEFKVAHRRAQRLDWSVLVPLAVLVVMLSGVFIIIPDRPGAALEDPREVMNRTLFAATLLCGWGLVIGTIGVFCLRWTARRQMRKRAAELVLNCPHCHIVLVGESQVIASQRCPSCRKRVLADPEPALTATEA
jgi:hypothetical protein